jgi:hypothetical protein
MLKPISELKKEQILKLKKVYIQRTAIGFSIEKHAGRWVPIKEHGGVYGPGIYLDVGGVSYRIYTGNNITGNGSACYYKSIKNMPDSLENT